MIGRRPPVPLEALAEPADSPEPEVGRRPVRFAAEWVLTPVLERRRLLPGARGHGPAVIRQLDATTLVEPMDGFVVDALGNIVIEVGW